MKKTIKMIVSDMDGTLVDYPIKPFNSTWDAFYDALGLSEENRMLRENYYPKKELETEWTDKQVGLLKGMPVAKALENLFPIPYSKGAKEFFLSLNGDYKKGILTSGISFVADAIKKELNFDFSISNTLNQKNERFTGTYNHENWLKLWAKGAKADKLKEISYKFKIPLDSICFIGDNDNDIPCFNLVALPVAFNPKTEETGKNAKYIISDFRELNSLLYSLE